MKANQVKPGQLVRISSNDGKVYESIWRVVGFNVYYPRERLDLEMVHPCQDLRAYGWEPGGKLDWDMSRCKLAVEDSPFGVKR